MTKHQSGVILLSLVVFLVSAPARGQSGGDFAIVKFVIANGGGESSGSSAVFVITGTIGQPKAGDNSSGTPFNVKTGFWTPDLVPTAAHASVSGRVLREGGQGIRGVTVTLIGATLVVPRVYLTNNLGYFVFEDLEIGTTYLVSVTHAKHAFPEPSRTFLLTDDLTDVDFLASW